MTFSRKSLFSDWIVAQNETEALHICNVANGSEMGLEQDKDVLDTWFCSSLIPIILLGKYLMDFITVNFLIICRSHSYQ